MQVAIAPQLVRGERYLRWLIELVAEHAADSAENLQFDSGPGNQGVLAEVVQFEIGIDYFFVPNFVVGVVVGYRM